MIENSSYQRLVLLLKEYLAKSSRNSVGSFQREFGLSNGYFRSRETSKKKDADKILTTKTLTNIRLAQPSLNMEWLVTGEGEPWVGKAKEDAMPVGRPYYAVDFLGGFAEMVNDQSINPTDYIYMEPYNKEGFYWCNLSGESMKPIINSGSQICLKHIGEGVCGVIYGKIYAIVTKSDFRTVKWVVRADDERKIRLVPENKDVKYGGFLDIPKSDVISIFQVVYAGNPI